MFANSRFEGKIDVLDLLINILKDHEENLSDVVDKLDVFLDNLSLAQKKTAKLDQILKRDDLSDVVDRLGVFINSLSSVVEKISRESTSEKDRHIAIVDCRKWSEFRVVSAGASLVAFEMDVWNVFSITSRSREFIFRFSESLPMSKNDAMPEGSASNKLPNLDSTSLRRWLSEELKVPEEKIIEGNLVKSLREGN